MKELCVRRGISISELTMLVWVHTPAICNVTTKALVKCRIVTLGLLSTRHHKMKQKIISITNFSKTICYNTIFFKNFWQMQDITTREKTHPVSVWLVGTLLEAVNTQNTGRIHSTIPEKITRIICMRVLNIVLHALHFIALHCTPLHCIFQLQLQLNYVWLLKVLCVLCK